MGMGGFRPITGTIGRGLGEFTLPGSNAAFCQSILQKGITGEALRLESLSYVLPREGQGPELTPAPQQPVVVNLLMHLRAYCDESNTFLRQQHNLQLQLTRQLDQALSTARGSVSSQAQQIRRAVEGEMLQAGQFQKALSELTQQLKKNGKSGEARLTRAVLSGSSAPVHGKQAPSVGPASSLKPETSAPSRTETERKLWSLHTTPLTVVQKQEQGETVREQAPSPRGLRRREAGHGPHAQGEVHSPSKGKTGRGQKKRGENSILPSHGEEIREPILSQTEETSRRSAAVTGKSSRERSTQFSVQGTPESVSQDSASAVSKLEHGSTARPVSAGSREVHGVHGEETERPGEKSLPVLRTFPAISHAVSVFQPKILSPKAGMPGPVGNLPSFAPSGALGMPSFLSVFPSSYVSFPFGGIAKTGAISPGPLTLASKGAAWGRKEEQLSLFSGRVQGTPWIGSPLSAERVFPGRKSQSPKAMPLRFREIGSNEEPASGYEVRPLFPSTGPRTEWAETRAEAGKAWPISQTGENKRGTDRERPGQEGVFGQKAAWSLGEKAKNALVSQSVSSKTPGLRSRGSTAFFPQKRAGLHSSLVHRAAAQAEQEAALSSVSSEAREPVYRTALPVGALSRPSALAGPQPVSDRIREPIYRTALPAGVFRSNPVDQGREASSFPPGRAALPPSPIPEPSRKWEGPSPLPLPRPWAWDGEPMRWSEENFAIRSETEWGKSFFSVPSSLSFLSSAVPAMENMAAIGRTSSLAPIGGRRTAAPARKRTLPFARPWRGGAWNGGKSFMPLTEDQSPLSHSSGVPPTAWEEEGPWDMVFRTSLDTQPEQGAEQERAEALSIGPMMGHLAFALEQGKTQEPAPLQKEGAPVIRRGQGLSSLLSLENARSPARPDVTSQAMVHTAFSPEFSEGTPVSQPDRSGAPSQDAPKGTGQSVVYRLPPRPQSAPQEKGESGEEVLRAQSVDAGYVSAMNAAYSYQAPESRPRPEAPGAISQETEERIIQQVLQDLNYNRMAAQVLDRVERRLRTERRKIGR